MPLPLPMPVPMPMPTPHTCRCAPLCDFATYDYKLQGAEMACVAREPDASTLLWYDLEHGKCTVKSADATTVVFDISVDSALMFTTAPYQKVLMLCKDPLDDVHVMTCYI